MKAERTTVIPRALEDVTDPDERRVLHRIAELRELFPDSVIDIGATPTEEEPEWPEST